MRKSFIREKKIYCGSEYMEADIIPWTAAQEQSRGKRKGKQYETPPKQRNLNDKNSKRYFGQLAEANFTKDDLVIHATFKVNFLPIDDKAAWREAKNLLSRMKYKRESEGLPPLKYLLVIEKGRKYNGTHRYHLHIIVNGGLSRDEIEALWCRRKKKGQKEGERIGYINVDRLQPDENGIAALCVYLTKDQAGKKRWSPSQNLIKPWSRNNDNKYSRRKVEQLAKNQNNAEYWEKQYPGYWVQECKSVYYDLTGWSIYLKLRKRC